MILGLISDTHGLLRESALRAMQNTGIIIHAGDVGDPKILKALEKLAPVTAVRGNVDIRVRDILDEVVGLEPIDGLDRLELRRRGGPRSHWSVSDRPKPCENQPLRGSPPRPGKKPEKASR